MFRFIVIVAIIALIPGPLQTDARKHRPTFWSFADRSRPQRPFHGGRVNRPMFDGNGCNPGTVALVNSSDATSYSLSVLFSTFTAQTSGTKTRDHKHCVITVALEPAENMQIGVAQVDFRGDAYVPGERSWARLQAFYRLGWYGREVLVNKRYEAGYDNNIYETGEVSPVSWTPCSSSRPGLPKRQHEFRIHAMISAAKKTVKSPEVSIAIDSVDANVQKGVYYQLTTRACPGTATSAPTVTPAPVKPAPVSPAPDTPAPVTPAPVTPIPPTVVPDTPIPSTQPPDTPAPMTQESETPAPSTQATDTPTPMTQAEDTPSTQGPDTFSPSTEAPSPPTQGPDTSVPSTGASDTPTLSTEAPKTPLPLTP